MKMVWTFNVHYFGFHNQSIEPLTTSTLVTIPTTIVDIIKGLTSTTIKLEWQWNLNVEKIASQLGIKTQSKELWT